MPSDLAHKRSQRSVLIAASVAAVLVAIGLGVRAEQRAQITHWTHTQAIPVVSWIAASRAAGGSTLRLPGHLVAWSEAPLHARVSGYLKAWYADIGDPMKAGQVLADIDSPELDQQIAQARAQLLRARSDAQIARTSAERWKQMLASHSVSQQEADVRHAAADAADAAVVAAQADLSLLQEQGAYRELRAPFTGTVTARRVDVGQLVRADDAGQALFDMVDNHRLRLMLSIPQSYAAEVHEGMHAEVSVPDRPGRQFQATLLGSAAAIDRNSDTLLAQFVIDNPEGVLLPGAYAEAKLALSGGNRIRIPVSALIFRSQGPQVAVVEAGDKIALRQIHIGLDLGNILEIDWGLKEGERIVNNPPDALRDGDAVRLAADGEPHAKQA